MLEERQEKVGEMMILLSFRDEKYAAIVTDAVRAVQENDEVLFNKATEDIFIAIVECTHPVSELNPLVYEGLLKIARDDIRAVIEDRTGRTKTDMRKQLAIQLADICALTDDVAEKVRDARTALREGCTEDEFKVKADEIFTLILTHSSLPPEQYDNVRSVLGDDLYKAVKYAVEYMNELEAVGVADARAR